MVKETMKVGVIGAGKIAGRHIGAYKKFADVEVVVSDIDGDASGRLASHFRIDCMGKTADIIENDAIQVVDVCTPVTSHKEIILAALKKGKHVFCEKPLCMSLLEAFQIKGAAENAEKMLMVGYLYRFHPAFVKVKEWLDEGLIGNVHFGIFRVGGRGSHQAWKHLLSCGGGVINEMLIHKLDLVLWYLDRIDSVKVSAKEILIKEREIGGQIVKADAEDMILLDLRCGGARIICEADFVSPVYMEYLEFHGDNGSIFTSVLSHLPTILFLKEGRGIYDKGSTFVNFQQVNLFDLEIGHFLNCIKNGTRNMNSIDDSIKALEIAEKLKEA
ncbi:MAG: Gfo/Idh/MocA family oxidoreductase [Nitrospiraceae bacterium]|nr:Gfo/Idh/MocA family oxidoreductase [Nitrospiraceae bacterium]